MSALPAKGGSQPIDSAIHLEFIRSVAEANHTAGLEEVESFHRAIFLHRHGKDLERHQQERHLLESRLVGLEARLEQVREKVRHQDKLVPVLEDGRPDTQPNAPWNLWDRTMFTCAACAIVCLLVFGVFNISFNLLESGIVTFSEHPIRAYLWAALLPVGALAVKVGWDFLQSRRRRTFYLWTCLSVGLISVLIWVAAYASVYPTLSKTVEEHLASLTVSDQGGSEDGFLAQLTSSGVKRIDMLLVAAQAMAEICLSAVLGIYMTQLYTRHRPVRLAENPAFVQMDAERLLLEESVERERMALAEAKGNEARLQNELSAFVSYARSLYQKEVTLRRDRSHQKRLLIEEMAEQLKTRLAAVEKDGEPADDGAIRPIAFNREGTR